jgi:hypothetical protein
MRMADFVESKREIFRIRLMLDTKAREMAEMEAAVVRDEAEFRHAERRIEALLDDYKHRSVQSEVDLAVAAKAAEGATTRRMELEKRLKLSAQGLLAMRQQIRRNEVAIETHRRYRGFLEMVGIDIAKRSGLVEVFEGMEKDNLFLMNQHNELRSAVSRRIGPLDEALRRMDQDLASLERLQVLIPVVEESQESLTEHDYRSGDAAEREFKKISALIMATYKNCFHRPADITVMGQLEQLENCLEGFYRALEHVSPAFVHRKQKKQEEERLEKRRLETQQRKVYEQRIKVDQALERARMPIKKRTGRPIARRTLPIVVQQVDEEKLKAEMKEKKRLETLLYDEELF